MIMVSVFAHRQENEGTTAVRITECDQLESPIYSEHSCNVEEYLTKSEALQNGPSCKLAAQTSKIFSSEMYLQMDCFVLIYQGIISKGDEEQQQQHLYWMHFLSRWKHDGCTNGVFSVPFKCQQI
mmetsp:Transcript_9421/g.12304  ORF Transcript_9421/g.12304 Transcript_9421/m.12304 type:complete len:125 (+) Transcript_9421:746-1120(+)